MLTAEELIDLLDIKPLPLEGGLFRETYRSADLLPSSALPQRYTKEKSAGTAIYYLHTPQTFSALHRLPTDEVYHFYLGDPVEMLQLWPEGNGRVVILGQDLRAGQLVQVVVPEGVWHGSRLRPGGSFALLGTTMAPGFDFADYEAATHEDLVLRFPEFASVIKQLTREL
jgi:predicted cupin superfamily sugar epimerase